MPPKQAAMPRIKCLKFGEILIDENRKVVLLCVNCFADFQNLKEFSKHLNNCELVQHIFKAAVNIKTLDCDNGTTLLTKVPQATKELHIYGVNMHTDLTKIEEELSDPRWYTDGNDTTSEKGKQTATYNNLIEEVTPFVQFKENVKKTTKAKTTASKGMNADSEKIKILQSKSSSDVGKQNKRKTLPIRSSGNGSGSSGNRGEVENRTMKEKCVELKYVKNNRTEAKSEAKTTAVPNSLKNVKLAAPIKRKTTTTFEEIDDTKRRRSHLTLGRPSQQTKSLITITTTTAAAAEATRAKTTTTTTAQKSSKVAEKFVQTQPAKKLATLKNQNTERQTRNQSLMKAKQLEALKTTTTKAAAPAPQPVMKARNVQIQQSSANLSPTTVTTVWKNTLPVVSIPPSTNTPTIATFTAPTEATITTTIPTQLHAQPNTVSNDNKTVEILNKLQTLGLKVQRTNTTASQSSMGSNKRNDAAMEIIKKLQSKGMEVKRLTKNNVTNSIAIPANATIMSTNAHTKTSTTNLNNYLSPSAIKRSTMAANAVLATKANFQKNVLIRKCN